MLSRQHRLTSKQDFDRITKTGRKVWGQYLIVKYIPSAEHSKFGFIVSTKISKKATQRNRIKRILRENIRLHFLPKQTKHIEAVVIAQKKIIGKNSSEINQDLQSIFKRINQLET
ncbi:ribonuclease P protein component [Patescibacteria group bacterium]|nr:ribonuclease P protein component [Patescibacteria group bacterium]